MKWISRMRDDYVWHEWFAWYPVSVRTSYADNTYCTYRVWLEPVRRKRELWWGGSYWTYEDLK